MPEINYHVWAEDGVDQAFYQGILEGLRGCAQLFDWSVSFESISELGVELAGVVDVGSLSQLLLERKKEQAHDFSDVVLMKRETVGSIPGVAIQDHLGEYVSDAVYFPQRSVIVMSSYFFHDLMKKQCSRVNTEAQELLGVDYDLFAAFLSFHEGHHPFGLYNHCRTTLDRATGYRFPEKCALRGPGSGHWSPVRHSKQMVESAEVRDGVIYFPICDAEHDFIQVREL